MPKPTLLTRAKLLWDPRFSLTSISSDRLSKESFQALLDSLETYTDFSPKEGINLYHRSLFTSSAFIKTAILKKEIGHLDLDYLQELALDAIENLIRNHLSTLNTRPRLASFVTNSRYYERVLCAELGTLGVESVLKDTRRTHLQEQLHFLKQHSLLGIWILPGPERSIEVEDLIKRVELSELKSKEI